MHNKQATAREALGACPHQRFAAIVLKPILKAQDIEGRESVGRMLQYVLADSAFPIAGLRLLMHELSFTDDEHRWEYLIPERALKSLIEMCRQAADSEERTFASLLLSELGRYNQNWPHELLIGRERIIGCWIEAPLEPSGFGLARLLHVVRTTDILQIFSSSRFCSRILLTLLLQDGCIGNLLSIRNASECSGGGRTRIFCVIQ